MVSAPGSRRLGDLRRTAAELAGWLGRHGEAAEWVWQDFTACPSLEGCQRLREHGAADGNWSGWRDRALGELRALPRLAKPVAPDQPVWARPAGHSVLVDILLWEGDVAAAWQAAQDGGCSEAVWLTLARKRADEHPADAVPVLRRHVESAVALAKRDGYERAVSLLTELARCHERADTAAELAEYVRALHTTHRRKRTFIAALDAARLPG